MDHEIRPKTRPIEPTNKGNKMNAAKLFDTIMDRHAIKNDAELGRQLVILPPQISRMRSGKQPVGASTLVKISETFDMPVKEIRELAAA